jgi:transcriptional regulator with XRE-family HTH domain
MYLNCPLDFIKSLRASREMTQKELAAALGMSPQTYAKIEQGKRDLSIVEAEKLADVFEITLRSLLENIASITDIEEIRLKIKNSQEKNSTPQKNIEKLKEVLLYILAKLQNKPHISQTVIYKLLYFIDFDFYEKFKEQLIGATYIKNHYGPAPIEFRTVIEDMINAKEVFPINRKYFNLNKRRFLPLREADLTKLTIQEQHHIDEVLARFGDKTAYELTCYAYGDIPCIVTEKGDDLDYKAVFFRTARTSQKLP